MDTELQNIRQLIKQIEVNADADLKAIIEKWRKSVIYEISDIGRFDPLAVEVLKARLTQINSDVQRQLLGKLTDNQKRLFIKGIQTVDRILEKGNLATALPYLSERKLKTLQNYSAELVSGISADARKRISTEIALGILGQKSTDDIIKEIGKSLNSPSVFGTIAKRAQVIYQTEVKRIQNQTTLDRMKQSVQQVPDLKKKWVHSHVGIPRPFHLLLHGTIVGVNEPFILRGADGNIYEVQSPYDPTLPASETVGCMCIIIGVVMRFQKPT